VTLRSPWHCAAALVALTFAGSAVIRVQAQSRGIPNSAFPGNAPSDGAGIGARTAAPDESAAGAGSDGSSKSATVSNETPESIAKANLEYFQTLDDPDAAKVTVRTVPEHADAWIDGKFVGPAPLALKLAPGLHQVLVRAPNMRDSEQELNLTAKQTQSVDIPLKANPQNRQVVAIHWPAPKPPAKKKVPRSN
jgi:hypothetical protein